MNSNKAASCIVIGAGIAGLLAARWLQGRGISVVVVDKGRQVGGRLATRRIDEGVFDHGAQFFTARDAEFAGLVNEWVDAGVVQEWCRGFVTAEGQRREDGHPRYRGAAGMTALAKHLAHGLDVRLNRRAAQVSAQQHGWEVRTDNGEAVAADALILTPPVPQSLVLLLNSSAASAITSDLLPPEMRIKLEAIAYEPCIAVMALLEGRSGILVPGGVQLENTEPIYWLADNELKGISPHRPAAVTIHATPQFSRAHMEMGDDEVARLLIESAADWLQSPVRSVQVKRWRYSKPMHTHDQRCLYVSTPLPLAFAGDAFGGPRVEGAALSGLAAAKRIYEGLQERTEGQS